jgi:glyoxylase-like metal-dependent hydrolase (beta-lactamase superfamily II)/8-oxo-dGTP pyrophosphatase MutT (NUDIX family)
VTAPSRDAGAVILVRGDGSELEVFLAERARELRFFGGYWAMPGGVRAAIDVELAGGSEDGALRHCAVRELFEETGVLLVPGAAGAAAPGEQLAQVRRALLRDDDGPWRALVARAQAAPEVVDVCRIRTPAFAPVRYDTLFALARLPAGAEPEIWPGELTQGRFWRPAEALAAWRRGEVLVVPPVLILLELLDGRTLEDFAAAARRTAESYRRGALHRVRFSPGILLASLETPTLPPATTTNCLIVGERSLQVIDPGAPEPAEQERLHELLAELVGEGRTLDGILLTHHHRDHVGGVAALSARFDLPVRAHRLTLERLPGGVRRGAALADGDRLPLGEAPDGAPGWYLQAFFTPGHAPGHLCFRDSRYGALIAGDMVSTLSTIVIDPPDGHMATYLRSLERLRSLPMTTLYPSHGPAARDGGPLVERYLRHRAERQAKLEAALAAGPATAAELLPVVYADVDPRMLPWAARSLLAGLQLLEERGQAEVADGRWRLR